MDTIESSAKMLSFTVRRMQSGAGHDPMTMNQLVETGMIFVPSKGGKSHAPSEVTYPEDLVNGVNVPLNRLVQFAQ